MPLTTIAVVLVSGCGGGGPALSVDGASFTEEQLLGLTDAREERLVALTALGLAFARDEAVAVGAPLIERWREDLLLDRFAADLVLQEARIDDEVLRAQYLTNPRYELVVRHVVALAEEEAPDSVHQSARATAEEALERLEAGEPMAEVAAELSEEPGAAERGGRLQPGRRGSWVSGFWQAANGLEEGEHTGVVRTEYGYHVIQLEERRTVPFEEVRSDVVLQAGTMLGGTDEAWARWQDSVSSTIRLDTAALGDAVQGGSLDLAPLALASDRRVGDAPNGTNPDPSNSGDAGGGDSPILATSDGGEGYRLDAFQRHLASLPKDRWSDVTRGLGNGPAADDVGSLDLLLAEVRNEAVRHRALHEASRRGLGLSGGPRDRTARQWTDQASAWAVSLGFQAGSSASVVAGRALEALSTTRQNASVAREEIESREPLLRAAYEVTEAGS